MNFQVVPIKGRLMLSPIKEQVIAANQHFGWNVEQTLADFANEFSEYYCLMDQQQLVGYIALHHIFDEASINLVYIKDSFRQQGLGTELMNFVLSQLAHRDVKHVFLEVRASNVSAIQLYQSTGFERLTIRKNYYHQPDEDAYLYQQSLVKGAANDNQ